MQEPEREQLYEAAWKSQEQEPMKMTDREVCAKARNREKMSTRSYWVLLGITLLFVAAFVRNLLQFREPWLIAGTSWILAEFCLFAWRLLRNGPARMRSAEPCLDYLRRELQEKHQGLLWISRGSLLLFPTILAMWLGGGPALGARQLGIESVLVLKLLQGPGLLIVMASMLAFVWFAFSREARKVESEIHRLG